MNEKKDYWIKIDQFSSGKNLESLRSLDKLAGYASKSLEGDIVTCSPGHCNSALVIGNATQLLDERFWFYDTSHTFNYYVGNNINGNFPSLYEKRLDEDKMIKMFDSLGLDAPIFSSIFDRHHSEVEVPERISFLHINSNVGVLVRLCLELFYKNVIPGGIVVLEDFGLWESSRRSFYEYCSSIREYPLIERCGPGQAYWIKGKTNNG